MIREAIARRASFNIVHLKTMFSFTRGVSRGRLVITSGLLRRIHSPSPLKAISTLTGREISSVQTQREVRWQLMGQRNGLAVERRLDGGFEVRRGIDSSEFGRVEQTVHQCRDLGALFRA